jgi:hypothetical protein
MKNLIVLIALVALSAFAFQVAFSQPTAVQTFNIAVNNVQKLDVTGNPGNLIITTGDAGNEALTYVEDATSSYKETHNGSASLKMTAVLGAGEGLVTGYKLEITLANGKGTSAGAQTLTETAADVVTSIVKGSATGSITYKFSADASAGELPSVTKHVTLTLAAS